jgi:hypothetical protein
MPLRRTSVQAPLPKLPKFQKTNIEQARKNLTEAVLCHFDALHELGRLRTTIQKLQHLSRQPTLRIEDLGDNEMLWKTTTAVPSNLHAATA